MDNKKQTFSDEEMSDVLRFHKKRQLQQHWKTLMEEEDKKSDKATTKVIPITASPKAHHKWLWAAAAMVALLIGCFVVWMLFPPTVHTPQQIASTYIENLTEFPSKGTKLGDSEAIFTQLAQFKKKELNQSLKEDDFKAIIQTIDKQEETFIQDNGLYLTRAYAYLKTAQYQAAIGDLNTYIKDGQWTTDKAEYYLALSYMGNGQLDEATRLLERLQKEQPKKISPLLQEIKGIHR